LFSGRRRNHSRRSASSDPKPNLLLLKASPKRPSNFAGSLTCPVPRKNMDFNFSGPRRQVYETDRPESEEELERSFEEIKARSGVIEIGPQVYRDVKIENLIIRAELGSGTCGNVTQRVLDNRLLAVKEMKKTDNGQETKRILRDLQVICKSNDCQYIVRSYGYILTYDHVYICMETMAMCLEKLYKNHLSPKDIYFPECILGKVAVSVIQALKYLKDTHNIIHRDIKPSNILIDWNGYIKLCDFGIAGQLIDSLASTSSLGCTAYLSPERIKREKYDIRADVWSLGVTLIELAMLQYPYTFQNPFDLMCCITDNPTPRLPESFSKEFRFFVDKCLEKKATSRPKYPDLMEFDWYKSHQDMEIDVGEWLSAVLVEEEED
jgi:mitogen-activated protein kinase kinase 7